MIVTLIATLVFSHGGVYTNQVVMHDFPTLVSCFRAAAVLRDQQGSNNGVKATCLLVTKP